MSNHAKRLRQLSGKPRRVEVEWIDSGLDSGWKEAGEVLNDLERPDALTCWTTGYLVDEREETLTVAGSYTVDPKTGLHNEYNSALTIPRVAVVEMRELRR